ncbi:MAG: acetyl-CoA carboxylase biotin carboxyl carrier protein [bacterium]
MQEDKIKRLVKIVEESNIAQLEISRWGRTIKITKNAPNTNSFSNSAGSQTYQVPAPPAPRESPPVPEKARDEEARKIESSNAVEMKSPMVGTLYRAPAPEADPYVEVNQMVKKGQVLCIIEAMKLMNEIESEYDGKIVEILVENGQPVEYNQPLFRIEP